MKSVLSFTVRFAFALAVLAGAASVARAQASFTAGQVGAAYTYQITTNPAAAAGTVYAATNLPDGLSIGSTSGLISGTPITAGNFVGTVSLTANSQTNNIPYQIKINPVAGTPVITTATLTGGTVGSAYSLTVAASPAATSFSLTGLPGGLTFDSTAGVISGTPTAAGTSTITISGTNSAGNGATVSLPLTIAPAAGTPVITNSPLAISGSAGAAITSFQVTASNTPTSFTASGLPLGLAINGSTGLISGTPSATGVSSVTLTAANASGTGSPATLTITIGALSTITNAATASGTQNSGFSLALTATNSPTSFNVSGLPSGLLANSSGVISGTPTVAGTFAITASANNAVGTGPNATITLTLAVPSSGAGFGPGVAAVTPVIVSAPSAVSVTAGGTANFAVNATASGATLSYQWLFNGAILAGQTSSTLSLGNAQAAAAGNYSVVVTATNAGGSISVTSATAALTVTPVVVPPVVIPLSITSQPVSQTVTAGASVTFSVAANGSGTITYQWLKNGAAISGATGASYTISTTAAADAGTYTVSVNNGTTPLVSNGAVLTVNAVVVPPPPAPPPTRLINVSISGFSGAVPQNLVVGLTIGGTGSKSVLVRAVGPALTPFGVPGALADPQLTVISGKNQVGFDDDWGGTAALSAVFAQTGAFPLPSGSKDAALLMSLASGASYTANVSAANGLTGTVLLEAYDADTAASPTASFVNLSARGTAGAGTNAMTIGFVISGTANKTILLRGIGPTLSGFGVAGAIPTTQLTLFSKAGAVLNTNTSWGGTAALTAAFTAVNAFALAPASQDSALLVSLAPGIYTAQLTGAGSSTASGVALLELYDAGP